MTIFGLSRLKVTADAIIICFSEQVLRGLDAFSIFSIRSTLQSVIESLLHFDVISTSAHDHASDIGIVDGNYFLSSEAKKLTARLTSPY